MKKKMLGIFICMLLTVVTVLPVVGTSNVRNLGSADLREGADWWTMFRHDLQHTGYSTSSAPDKNSILWSYTTGLTAYSSPAVADGKVYIGSHDNKVYCLNANTGGFIWSYTTGNLVWSSPAVADGKVYIGSNDYKVYCFGTENQPPSAPIITGPNSGKTGQTLTFTFNSVDPDEDDIRFLIEWGDTNTDTSDFVASGTDKSVSHIWSAEDTYTITARAEDTFGNIGPSATKQVTIPRDKAINKPFLNFLQSHPSLFPILQKLLQQIGFPL